jgi:hypothetical protein
MEILSQSLNVQIIGFNEALCKIEQNLSKDDKSSIETISWLRKHANHVPQTYYSEHQFNVGIGQYSTQVHYAPTTVFFSILAMLSEDESLRKEVFGSAYELLVDMSLIFWNRHAVFGVNLEEEKLTPRIRLTQNLCAKDLSLYRVVWLP